MRAFVPLLLLALAACSPPPPATFSHPPADAPVWNLNPGLIQGTNTLVTPPPRAF